MSSHAGDRMNTFILSAVSALVFVVLFFVWWLIKTSAGTTKQISVRRREMKGDWAVIKPGYRSILKTFPTELLEDVSFVHRAIPMTCEAGWNFTGEITGQIIRDPEWREYFYGFVSRSEQIKYDEKRLRFVSELDGRVVDSCDFLRLIEDGKMIAWWK